MPPPLLVHFAAGASGLWRIETMDAVTGPGLPAAKRLAVLEGSAITPPEAATWVLRGTTSNTRYTSRAEVDVLASRQQGLLRAEATHAALLPIRKTEAWWALAQDERRDILEEQSRHIAIGLHYLPPSPAVCTMRASWASRSISSHGSSSRPNIATTSMNCLTD